MPISRENMSKHGREAEEQGLEMVLVSTQALFKSRKTLTESCFDTTMKTCKAIVRRTTNSEHVRNLIGNAPQQWKDMTEVFALAIPVLEAQSLAAENAQDGTSISSSTLMAANHDTLMKDLERLNDILLIARNVLATTPKVQDLAGESLLDQQVLKLIDLCVRVTARGYDGDAGSRAELLWGNVIGSCKAMPRTYFRQRLIHRQTRSFSLPVSSFSTISYKTTNNVSFFYGLISSPTQRSLKSTTRALSLLDSDASLQQDSVTFRARAKGTLSQSQRILSSRASRLQARLRIWVEILIQRTSKSKAVLQIAVIVSVKTLIRSRTLSRLCSGCPQVVPEKKVSKRIR